MEVNGHTYYDIRWVLNNYERMINEKEKQVLNLDSRIREIKADLEELHNNFPTIKQAIMEWMEYQKAESEG